MQFFNTKPEKLHVTDFKNESHLQLVLLSYFILDVFKIAESDINKIDFYFIIFHSWNLKKCILKVLAWNHNK